MPAQPTTLQEQEIQTFLVVTRALLADATVSTPLGLALRATPPDGKHPEIDLRTLVVAIVTLGELRDHAAARAFCAFLLRAQTPAGSWAAAYDEQGAPLSASQAEDATALALWALMTHVQASGDQAFAEETREAVDAAVRYIRARTLNPYLYLIETTSSLHGAGVSEGYELWNNCAHAAAFALCHRVFGGERNRRLALLIRRAIGLHLTGEGRFLRRLDPSGYPDPRPDIALMAPYYFRLWTPTERMVMNSADLIERTLWNVEIGGYIRFLPFSVVERQELPGPAPRFAGWMAQYHYELGNKDRAEAIMRWIFDHAVNGQLADVLVPRSSVQRFAAERRRLLANGIERDSRSGGLAQRALDDLAALEAQAEQREVIPSGAPLVWAHLETLRALHRGGYLQHWSAGLTESGRGGGGQTQRT